MNDRDIPPATIAVANRISPSVRSFVGNPFLNGVLLARHLRQVPTMLTGDIPDEALQDPTAMKRGRRQRRLEAA